MISPSPSNPEVRTLSFEEALTRLQEVVIALESGSLSLDETIERHRLGASLAAHCQLLLTEAELRISEVSSEPDAASREDAGEDTTP